MSEFDIRVQRLIKARYPSDVATLKAWQEVTDANNAKAELLEKDDD